MDIRTIDAADQAEFAPWYAAYRAAETHDRPFPMALAPAEMRAVFVEPEPGRRVTPYSLTSDGEVVAVGLLRLSLLDNPELANVALGVVPERRRQGLGSALLDRLEGDARAAGRTRLLVDVETSYDGPEDGSGHPDAEFFRSRGYTLGLPNVQRLLDLPVDEALLDKLEAQATERHEGYTFADVTMPLPDHLVLPVGQLRADVGTEAPMGDIVVGPEHVDVARVRGEERMLAAMGRQAFSTLAFAPDGSLAAYTEVGLSVDEEQWLYQWGTLVRRAHRGHSLGLAVKVRSTRWLQGLFPDRIGIRTFNADENAHMIAINEQLGYRPVARLGEWQKVV